MGIIYTITNKVNGKQYVGQTIRTLSARKGEHLYRCNSSERDHKLYLAMRKYGTDNFKFDIIHDNIEDLDTAEKELIKELNTYNRGYNSTEGGDGVSEETRKKLSRVLKGRDVSGWIHKVHATRAKNNTYGTYSFRYKIKTPDGNIVTGKNTTKFCADHNIDHSNLLKTRTGRNCCKGYMLLGTFNDYSERKYTQVSGNGEYPEFHQDKDIVSSA